jgi:hypothetical protein
MKTAIFVGVVGVCGLAFLLGISGLLDPLLAPSVPDRSEGEPPTCLSITRIIYLIFHPKIENKVIFRCEVSSGTEEAVTPQEESAGVVAKYRLKDILLTPGAVEPGEPVPQETLLAAGRYVRDLCSR